MRTIKHFTSFILCVVTFAGLSSMNVDNAYCAERSLYIGEYCWDTAGGAFARLGITLMGDGHFTFNGTLTSAEGLEWAINGNLEVVGSSVMGTLAGSVSYDNNTAMQSSVSNIMLNVLTLDGTYNEMVLRWEQGECFIEHDADTLFSVGCDKSVSPDGVDKREELIRLLKKYSTTSEE